MKIRLEKTLGTVEGVKLVYNKKIEEISYPVDYKLEEQKQARILTIKLQMDSFELKETYWKLVIYTRNQNEMLQTSVYMSKIQRLKLLLLNYKCNLANHYIVFPKGGKNGKMLFCYRKETKYDGFPHRLKEYFAFLLYFILKPFWKRKRIWLVFEKFCSMAQDNGYYFFKYCMEQLPESERKHIFFVLDEDSPDWEKMKTYGKQIIPFMSLQHMVYAIAAKVYVASDAKPHLYAWHSKPNLIYQQIRHRNILFLQHGVTALKRVDSIFGRAGGTPMTHFLTTSETEQRIVTENFGYNEKDAPILGFARWDALEDKSGTGEKSILVMPTWRSWLAYASPEEFTQSDYYNNYRSLLENERLISILREKHIKLIFYIHPKLKDYISHFDINEAEVELIPFGKVQLNELIMKCSLLVTDYSSVCWDVCYLGKPVIFYQFDYSTYMETLGSYLDMKRELPGDRCEDIDSLINIISGYIKSNFEEKAEYRERIRTFYRYRDKNNSSRIYEYLIRSGY